MRATIDASDFAQLADFWRQAPDGVTGIQLDDAGPVMFAGVLCHACRLSLTTVRYLERMP